MIDLRASWPLVVTLSGLALSCQTPSTAPGDGGGGDAPRLDLGVDRARDGVRDGSHTDARPDLVPGEQKILLDQPARDASPSPDQQTKDASPAPDQSPAVVAFLKGLASGTPYFLNWTTGVGTLQPGGVYLVRHDPLTAKTTTSSIREYNAISEYPNPTIGAGEISIWGFLARAAPSSSGVCLVSAQSPSGPCYAEVLAPYLPPGLFGQDIVEAARVEIELSLDTLTKASYDPGSCPSKPQLKMENQRFREIGWLLHLGAGLLRFIPDQARYASFDAALSKAVSYLVAHFTDAVNTSYTSCYGASEMQTGFQVMAGVDAYRRISKRADLPAYLIGIWSQLFQSGFVTTVGQAIASPPQAYCANALGQYLVMAVIAQRLGVDAIQGSFTAAAVQRVLYDQTNSPPEATCSDPGGSFTMTYGGWRHCTNECSQKLGYHAFTVFGLLSLDAYLREQGHCQSGTPYWQFACQNIQWNVLAALAWLHNLQQPSGAIYDIAPGSGGASSHWGTPIGGALAFAILSSWSGVLPSSIQVSFAGSTAPLATLEQGAVSSLSYISKGGTGLPLGYSTAWYLRHRLLKLGVSIDP